MELTDFDAFSDRLAVDHGNAILNGDTRACFIHLNGGVGSGTTTSRCFSGIGHVYSGAVNDAVGEVEGLSDLLAGHVVHQELLTNESGAGTLGAIIHGVGLLFSDLSGFSNLGGVDIHLGAFRELLSKIHLGVFGHGKFPP